MKNEVPGYYPEFIIENKGGFMKNKTGMFESLLVLVVTLAILYGQTRFPQYAYIPQEILVATAGTAFSAFGLIVRSQIKGGDK